VSSAPQPSDYYDGLTELPNRRLFDDRLKQALHLAKRRDSGIALTLVELLGFTTAADDTVREAARRLGCALRKADTLARWGAAEFAAILTDVTDDTQCRIVAERLLAALDMDVAMGISRFPSDAFDGVVLVRNADAARARARELGRRHYRLYAR
jgi:diguanylate cyclase (GGDEF)-like protein